MKRLTAEWVRKAEADFAAARNLRKTRPPLHDQVCFHCQQTVEKYLKALLQEHGLPIPKTHDLTLLVSLVVSADKTCRELRCGTKTMTRFAVEYRYPGFAASATQARAAFTKAAFFRERIRKRLGLRTRRVK